MSFSEIIYRIMSEAIVPGVSSVLSFIPTIAVMVFLLTLLREIGLIKGPAALFLTGFSCSVPAITYCHTIPDKRIRFLTIFLIPYISCSAKLPIYVMLSSVFFPVFPMAAVSSIYLIGILLVTISLISAKHLGFMQSPDLSLMQSPSFPSGQMGFRLPSARLLFDAVAECCISFVKKAFTVILAASIAVWFLQNVDTSLHYTYNIGSSLLASFGRLIAPVFSPLGFGDWRAVSSLLVGITSKESVVSTFAVIAGTAEKDALYMMLAEIFTPASAFSFMVFCLLYIPCIATLIAIKNATGNIRLSLAVLICQTVLAWSLSFLIFHSIKVII